MTMSILLLEDDSGQSERIRHRLMETEPSLQVEIVATEEAFIDNLPRYSASPPSCFVLDMMVRWTDPAPDQSVRPEEVKRSGPGAAGARCLRKIRENQTIRSARVVIFSILGSEEIRRLIGPDPARIVGKGNNWTRLVDAVREELRFVEVRKVDK